MKRSRSRVHGHAPDANPAQPPSGERIADTACATTAEITIAPPARVSRVGTSPTPSHTQMGASTVSARERRATSAAGEVARPQGDEHEPARVLHDAQEQAEARGRGGRGPGCPAIVNPSAAPTKPARPDGGDHVAVAGVAQRHEHDREAHGRTESGRGCRAAARPEMPLNIMTPIPAIAIVIVIHVTGRTPLAQHESSRGPRS